MLLSSYIRKCTYMGSMQTKINFSALNGLRGFAVLIVFFSHISNDNMHIFPNLDLSGIGKSGVYLFFILSSFLLSLPLLKISTDVFQKSQLLHYGKRRFFRIYPLFALYLLCGLISTWVFSRFLGITEHAVPFPLSVSEFINHIMLLDGKGVTWSIAVEFKFYILLPFLTVIISVLAKQNKTMAFIFILSLCALSLAIYPVGRLRANDPSLMPYSIVFLTGVLLAFIQLFVLIPIKRFEISSLFTHITSAILLTCFVISIPSVYAIIFPDEPFKNFGKNLQFFSLLWGITLLFCINSKNAFFGFFNSKWLAFFGAISFSFYLIHSVIIGVFQFFDINTVFNGLLILCITTLISKFTYDFVEKPSLIWADRVFIGVTCTSKSSQ
jgi:peptidoglycan/LPS O-acetylase OafA/YrhL